MMCVSAARMGNIAGIWSAEYRSEKRMQASSSGIRVTTPNVTDRTLRNLDHSFEAAKGRRGLKAPLRRRFCQAEIFGAGERWSANLTTVRSTSFLLMILSGFPGLHY